MGAFSDGVPYLVMEYVEGRNLSDAMEAEGRLSIGDARDAIAQLAAALAAAHEHNIIHRDLKPANVFREQKTGRMVLGDFGIAGLLESGGPESTRLTRVGEVLGDFRYMSPEQMRGETLTAATDVYALGVLGYELLTGEGPYGVKKPAELAAAHLRQPPLKLPTLRPEIDQGLSDLLERCLAKKPEHRPRASDVERALTAGPADAAAMSGSPGVPRSAIQSFIGEMGRRKVWRVGVAYVVVGSLVLEGAGNVIVGLPVPEWSYNALVAVVLALFPITLVLSWMFDLTSDGIRRTESLSESGGGRGLLALQLSGLAVSLGLAALIALWVLRERG